MNILKRQTGKDILENIKQAVFDRITHLYNIRNFRIYLNELNYLLLFSYLINNDVNPILLGVNTPHGKGYFTIRVQESINVEIRTCESLKNTEFDISWDIKNNTDESSSL